ncbi:hypothetical protein P0O24_10020 [Methanotrichaceae archaeon M04Ac]|uniref:Uncharacterized protein n=1 Tax=Candidatus Methanocrinis alkalitolerans TaxID=3033395 RepID=A0ABT5XH05_9EURY|nr:hypothetical protein [Candidatus Methanocrinis alkalitolerans]
MTDVGAIEFTVKDATDPDMVAKKRNKSMRRAITSEIFSIYACEFNLKFDNNLLKIIPTDINEMHEDAMNAFTPLITGLFGDM